MNSELTSVDAPLSFRRRDVCARELERGYGRECKVMVDVGPHVIWPGRPAREKCVKCSEDVVIRRVSTYEVLLELLHLLLVAFQPAVVHGSALDGDLSHLEVHLLQLKPTQEVISLHLMSQT